jgi:hypothetical protein
MREWRRKNPEKRLLSAARDRAKQKGLSCTITAEDIIIPEFCPVLGLKLDRNARRGKKVNAAPSLDRIDNAKGYIKGNVEVISWRANNLKRDATAEELEAVATYIRKGKWRA